MVAGGKMKYNLNEFSCWYTSPPPNLTRRGRLHHVTSRLHVRILRFAKKAYIKRSFARALNCPQHPNSTMIPNAINQIVKTIHVERLASGPSSAQTSIAEIKRPSHGSFEKRVRFGVSIPEHG